MRRLRERRREAPGPGRALHRRDGHRPAAPRDHWGSWTYGAPDEEHAASLAKATGLGQTLPVSGDVYGVITEEALEPWREQTPYSCVLTPDFELLGCIYGHEFDPVYDLISDHAG